MDNALLFVSVSMILLALVAVVAWDGLALDARDEAILGPLPIPRATIVGAKLAAMGALAGAVLLALNGPSSVLHASAVVAQLRVSVPGALRLMLAHAIACGAAGAFGFCTVLALREVCRAALGPWWPAVSTRLQALLIVVLATTFLLMPGWMGRVAERIVPAAADWRTAASPPMWFVGLHQVLAGRVVVDIPAKALPTRVQADEDRSAALFDRAQPGAAAAGAHGARGPGRVVRRRRRGLPVERPEAGGARPHAAARRRAAAIASGSTWSPPPWPGRRRCRPASSSRCGRSAAACRIARRWPWPRRSAWRWRPSASAARCARRRRRRGAGAAVDADDVPGLPARRLRTGDAAARAPAGLLEPQARLAGRRPRLRRRREARHGRRRRHTGARAPAARPAVVPPAAASRWRTSRSACSCCSSRSKRASSPSTRSPS